MKRIVAATLIALLAIIAIGCTQADNKQAEVKNVAASTEPVKVKIGTLPTEDTLPIYVAQQKELFKKQGVEVEVIVFNSAQERDAALQAGQIDGFMGDMIAAAALEQGGVDISIVSVLLGATPKEGRFGILVSPQSKIKTAAELKGVPIAISSNTIIEYVVDGMLKENGLTDADIKKIEIKKIPVRLEALMSGQAEAAALPDPLLFFAQEQGAHLILDDTKGANVSQTVLLFKAEFLSEHKDAVKSMLAVINDGVEMINENPDAYRDVLVEKAKLPEPIAKTYKVNTYPTMELPAKADVDRLLDWMVKKNIIKAGVTYDDLVDRGVQQN